MGCGMEDKRDNLRQGGPVGSMVYRSSLASEISCNQILNRIISTEIFPCEFMKLSPFGESQI
jgi:hypothetical protein